MSIEWNDFEKMYREDRFARREIIWLPLCVDTKLYDATNINKIKVERLQMQIAQVKDIM